MGGGEWKKSHFIFAKAKTEPEKRRVVLVTRLDLLSKLQPFPEKGGNCRVGQNGRLFHQSECSKNRILNRKISANLLYLFIGVEILI